MNYRHIYHAGNFADVLKHSVLIAIFDILSKKDTPFFYLDTHAGCGYYDLHSEAANKTKEYCHGVEKIRQRTDQPSLVQRYLTCLRSFNNDQKFGETTDSLRFYPGSPFIASYFSRTQDRVLACELQLEQFNILKSNINQNKLIKKITAHNMNGFLALKALLPPLERRGLVLIDPPYEGVDEFDQILNSLKMGLRRWEKGIYAVWYPLKDKKQVESFSTALIHQVNCPILFIELSILPALPHHLYGCGVVIVNPPWLLDQKINDLLPWLWQVLSLEGQGDYRCVLKNAKIE